MTLVTLNVFNAMDAVCCNALMPQLSDPADRLVPQAGVSVALWLYGRGGTAPARAQHLM